MPQLIDLPVVELVFQPVKPNEAHALACLHGDCPERLLKIWTTEFQQFFEKRRAKTDSQTITFSTTQPGIPKSYQVEFEKQGRTTIAHLTSMLPSKQTVSNTASSAAVTAEQSVAVVPPADWRPGMLCELQTFIESFVLSEPDRYCLEYAFQRLQGLAEGRPQYFTLTVFAAFIAAAQAEEANEAETQDYLFRAAAKVLQRAVLDSEPEVILPDELERWHLPGCPTFTAMLNKWLPKSP